MKEQNGSAPVVARRKRERAGKSVDPSPVPSRAGTPTCSKTQGTEAKEGSTMRIIGLDLGNSISFCELAEGVVKERGVVRCVEELLRTVLGDETGRAVVAVEACREAWHVHDVLTSAGHKVVLVDTTRARQLGIGQHGRKTNRVDAEVLARALAENRIPCAHVLSPNRRVLREHVMVRAGLVETRSRLIVTVRGLLRSHGHRIRSCSPSLFTKQVRTASAPEASTKKLIEPLCGMIDDCDGRISELEKELIELAESEPIAKLLMSAPGVSLVTSLTFVSVVDEAKRFKNAHQLESYLGLVPAEFSTGDNRTLGRISKAGNPYLRAVLVQAAWSLMMHAPASDPLRRWAEAVAERRGKKVASIALARRLAGVLWAMWRDGTFYDAKSVENSRAKRDPQQQAVLKKQSERVRKSKLQRYGITRAAAPSPSV